MSCICTAFDDPQEADVEKCCGTCKDRRQCRDVCPVYGGWDVAECRNEDFRRQQMQKRLYVEEFEEPT